MPYRLQLGAPVAANLIPVIRILFAAGGTVTVVACIVAVKAADKLWVRLRQPAGQRAEPSPALPPVPASRPARDRHTLPAA